MLKQNRPLYQLKFTSRWPRQVMGQVAKVGGLAARSLKGMIGSFVAPKQEFRPNDLQMIGSVVDGVDDFNKPERQMHLTLPTGEDANYLLWEEDKPVYSGDGKTIDKQYIHLGNLRKAILARWGDAESVEIRCKGEVIGEGWGSYTSITGKYIKTADTGGALTFLLKAKKGVRKIRSPEDLAALKYSDKFTKMIEWPAGVHDVRKEKTLWTYLRDDYDAEERMPEDHLCEEAQVALKKNMKKGALAEETHKAEADAQLASNTAVGGAAGAVKAGGEGAAGAAEQKEGGEDGAGDDDKEDEVAPPSWLEAMFQDPPSPLNSNPNLFLHSVALGARDKRVKSSKCQHTPIRMGQRQSVVYVPSRTFCTPFLNPTL